MMSLGWYLVPIKIVGIGRNQSSGLPPVCNFFQFYLLIRISSNMNITKVRLKWNTRMPKCAAKEEKSLYEHGMKKN